jgi:SNF2 family DNA or RNA helicase
MLEKEPADILRNYSKMPQININVDVQNKDILSDSDIQKAIKEIQDPDSKIRFLVGTPQTGGYGITLTEANVMIYYSNGYDLEKRTQSEARINRIGQTRKMTYIDIIAEKTVDERIVKALRKKINIASEVMGEELKDWI